MKNLLKDQLGLGDGLLPVTEEPVWLGSDADGLELARLALAGEATTHLPVVYLSAPANRADGLSESQIRKLAFELGGVAHVLVEPDRAFSFELRDRMDGGNPYGGTVGITVPGLGLVRRIWLGGPVPDAATLKDWVRDSAITQRGVLPARGWDWTQLQDEALREQRKGALTFDVERALYEEIVANLQERIADLQRDLEAERTAARETRDIGGAAALPAGTIPEIYPGELTDRLRWAARRALDAADRDGLDARSHDVLTAFLATHPEAPGRAELIAAIKAAVKDGAKLAEKLGRVLKRHGYRDKSDNKHIWLEAAEGFEGLGSITLAKTPSEYKGQKNQRSQILNTLGLSARTD